MGRCLCSSNAARLLCALGMFVLNACDSSSKASPGETHSGVTGRERDAQVEASGSPCALGKDDCSPHATCKDAPDTAQGFSCECKKGWSGDGVSCKDEDECALGTDNCDAHATCTNKEGGFTCACNDGYKG